MSGWRKEQEDPSSQDANMQDANMQDVPSSAQHEENKDADMGDDAEAEEEEEVNPQRVKILPGSTDTAASFEFTDEGHTVGNALRYIIMKNPDVEFCAYAIPHPSEPKMNVRIQTYERTAVDALKKGLSDLQEICDVIAEEFWAKGQSLNEEQGIER